MSNVVTTNGKTNSSTNPVYTSLTGSNVEQTIGSAVPSKANLMGISDGTTIRAMHGNMQGTLLASAARTTSTDSPVVNNVNGRGVWLYLNVTANPGGTETLQIAIWGRDPVSNTIGNLVAFPVTTAATNTIYRYLMYPGARENIATNGVEAQDFALPPSWGIRVYHSGAGSWTYSVGYALMI